MASSDNSKRGNELSSLLNDLGRNTRHDIWLWLWLWLDADEHQRDTPDPSTCNSSTMGDEITYFLKGRSYIVRRITRDKDRSLIPDASLAWIDTDERTYQWLLGRLLEITGARLPRRLVHLKSREHLIAIIDIWDIDLDAKAREVESLSEMWRRHKAMDSAFYWFEDKKEGTRRCKCAWEWLEKNYQSPFKRQLPISNYKELLMYFDEADFGRIEQKNIINEIKRRWNRQQLDVRNPDKKQFNVMLPVTVIDQIDELADKYDLKRAKVVEILVQLESENSILIPEWLKAQRNP